MNMMRAASFGCSRWRMDVYVGCGNRSDAGIVSSTLTEKPQPKMAGTRPTRASQEQYLFSRGSVEIPETDIIRRFAYEKWVYFFEKFYVDGEEEIMTRRSGFICLCLVDNFLQFFKVQSKLDPSIAP
jgi:hypothetical protein